MNFRKTFSLFLILGYFLISSFGLFALSTHPGEERTHCPYVPGMHSMCAMNPLEHIDAWKAMMATALSLISFAIFLQVFPFVLSCTNLSCQSVKKRPERQYYPYVLLFSKGILNPKVF